MAPNVTVGILALQGAFHEHISLFRAATSEGDSEADTCWSFVEVRTSEELARCDALVIPGGESTTMALVAERSGLLEPLRNHVKILRKPTWGTCAGLILLAEAANRVKRGGQDLIGGLDVRVNRNHYGTQRESFEADVVLEFLDEDLPGPPAPFRCIFIRAPMVEKILPHKSGEQTEEGAKENTVIAPSRLPTSSVMQREANQPVQVLGKIKHPIQIPIGDDGVALGKARPDDVIAVQQGNVFGTSFHPELTQDHRIHSWWLRQVMTSTRYRK